MVDGYQRRNRAQGIYFRELYALLFNVNRSEKTPYLEPKEVLLLPGEKKKRKSKSSSTWTLEEVQEMQRKFSNSWQEP